MRPEAILVIAGHDSSGRAGVDADREAAAAAGLETVEVLSARTEQSGDRVHAITPRSPEVWEREARAALALEEVRIVACKVGLLPGPEHVEALASLLPALEERKLPCVVDPVLAATGGEEFLDSSGQEVLLARVLRSPVYLTPNLPEAARLTGLSEEALASSSEARVGAARALLEGDGRSCRGVLLKGGHGGEDPVTDLVLEAGAEPLWHRHRRLKGRGIRGSGCRYATTVAGGLGKGLPLFRAAAAAGEYLLTRMRHGTRG